MQDDVNNPEADEAALKEYFKNRKIWMLYGMLLYSVILGLILPFLGEENRIIDLIIGLPIVVMYIVWCSLDAEEHGYGLGITGKMMLIMFFPILFPIYIFKTRGALKGIWMLLKVCIFYVMCMVFASFSCALMMYLTGHEVEQDTELNLGANNLINIRINEDFYDVGHRFNA